LPCPPSSAGDSSAQRTTAAGAWTGRRLLGMEPGAGRSTRKKPATIGRKWPTTSTGPRPAEARNECHGRSGHWPCRTKPRCGEAVALRRQA
jgi:hypothetical protein